MKKRLILSVCVVLGLAVIVLTVPKTTRLATAADEAAAPKVKKAALQRTRKMTQTLDNIFKQTVVMVTDKYVHDEDDFAAGSAAVLLFDNISKSGDNKVRLIDATGEPYEDKNVAQDDFEREGIKQLKAGAKLYEQVVTVDGKPLLRTVTPVPVVMKKCIMCHEHYGDVKEGQPIGAISYTIPIE